MQVFRPLFAAITGNNLHSPAMRRKDPQRQFEMLYLCSVIRNTTAVKLNLRHVVVRNTTRCKNNYNTG